MDTQLTRLLVGNANPRHPYKEASTELAAIRADILHLAQVAASSDDYAALKRLQGSIVNWIHKNMKETQ